jgi:anti-sigma regulatory factor (Ser/Thr protein kinase)
MRSPDTDADSKSAGISASDTLELVLAPGLDAPRAARVAVGRWLAGQVGDPVRDDVLLVVSELVSNSVRHAGGVADDVIHVRVQTQNGRLHLAVEDAGRNGDFARRPASPQLHSGFGLNIVDKLALRWGVNRRGGTRVWAELARSVGKT